MPGKNGRKWSFHQDVHFKIGSPGVESFNQWQRQNGVAQRSQTDDKDPAYSLKIPAQDFMA
jgi:hypothetical protein